MHSVHDDAGSIVTLANLASVIAINLEAGTANQDEDWSRVHSLCHAIHALGCDLVEKLADSDI